MKDFEQPTDRGVKARLYPRPLRSSDLREEAILDTWEGMGVESSRVYGDGARSTDAIESKEARL